MVELGLHRQVSAISSVSGGSIVAGAIMFELAKGDFEDIEDFDNRVTKLLRVIGQTNLRQKIIKHAYTLNKRNLKLLFKPRTRFSNGFPALLDEFLFKNKCMVDLPSEPEWSCNATCLNTMKRFRFKVSDCYGYLLGKSNDIEDIKISFAVSAAFPMLFRPITMDISNKNFVDPYGKIPSKLYLTDGGVYDNLGSENILKDDGKFIVLDASVASRVWGLDYKPHIFSENWWVIDTAMSQIVNLRRRMLYNKSKGIQLIINHPVQDICKSEEKSGYFVGEDFDYTGKPLIEKAISNLRTDLDTFNDIEIDTLIWSGAIKMDLAIKGFLI